MRKKLFLSLLIALLLAPSSQAIAQVQQVKFGILRLMPDGRYEMDRETTRIPRRLKDTGFRFGVAFNNPKGSDIEWYEIVYLPKELEEITGDLRQINPHVLQSDKQRSNQKRVVDHFWFDKGDPLGRHRLELFVNGILQFTVAFDVVDPR